MLSKDAIDGILERNITEEQFNALCALDVSISVLESRGPVFKQGQEARARVRACLETFMPLEEVYSPRVYHTWRHLAGLTDTE